MSGTSTSVLVSTIHSHYVLWDISLCYIFACLRTIYFNQFRRFDREKLHMLCDQSWTILSKQTEIPKNAEWRILWLAWSFTKIHPHGNFSVIPDENPMSCDVADLMINLRLYLSVDSSDKQHPRYWNLTLFAVLRRSNSALPWRCQYLFIEFACFGWSQAKPRHPNQVQCPIFMDIAVFL